MHHLGFFMDDLEHYENVLREFGNNGFSVLQSGRFGDALYTYYDTEGAIGAVMEIVYIDPGSRELMARIKRGDF